MCEEIGLEPDVSTKRMWLDYVAAVVNREQNQFRSSVESLRQNRPAIQEEALVGGMPSAISYLISAAEDALDTTASGYMAYIPGGGLFATAIADFASDVLNRYIGLAEAAPALARLESDVLQWLACAFGYSETAQGSFTSGGSLATFAAVVCAREAALRNESDIRKLVGYTSSEAHSSIEDAFRLAGLPVGNLRRVPTDSCFRLPPEKVRELTIADRAQGFLPFIVIATAGTTNTGAIDPLSELGAIAHAEQLWMHTDAAYGGAFVLCSEGRQLLLGIEHSDSITFDPHKGLFLPYGTGCVLFKRAPLLPEMRSDNTPYLRDLKDKEKGCPSFPAGLQLELTRPFRGLRLWLPLIVHGARAFREGLEEKLDLARMLRRGLESMAEEGYPIEIVTPPQLSIVSFRVRRIPGEAIDAWNDRNMTFLKRINATGRTILSSTWLPSGNEKVLAIRACILSYQTHAKDVENCLDDIRLATVHQSRS